MMRIFAAVVAAAAALLFTVSAPVFAQAQRVDVTGPYTQEASGMVFPERTATFKRVSLVRYNPDGTDMSAAYAFRSMVATIYVYLPLASDPSVRHTDAASRARATREEYEAAKSAVITANPSAQLVREEDVEHKMGNVVYAGRRAIFRMTMNVGGTPTKVQSELWVYAGVGTRWGVKYRITYPEADAGNFVTSAAIATFNHELAWTIRPDGK
jgi:hypothetical protein